MWLGVQDVEFGGPTGTRATKDGKGQFANHSPKWYLNEEVMKTGVRLYSNIVLDFLSGEL